MTETRTAAILFGGIGGFSAGLKRSLVEAYGKVYRCWINPVAAESIGGQLTLF